MWYKNCKCRKKLIDKLIDECNEAVEEVKLAKKALAENETGNKYSSCTVYMVLMIEFLQFLLELLLILFITIGLWLKIIFCALSLMLTKKQGFGKLIKWEKSNKLTLKIELIIFTTIKLI